MRGGVAAACLSHGLSYVSLSPTHTLRKVAETPELSGFLDGL